MADTATVPRSSAATTAPTLAKKTRPVLAYNPALDGLRCLAVVSVMLYHADLEAAGGGFFGVDLFFVLSGWLITTLLLMEHAGMGRISLGGFWKRRAVRLLPALFAVVAWVVVYANFFAPATDGPSLRDDVLGALFYVSNWRFSLADVSYFDAFREPSPLLHTWSLAIEEQWYLILPLGLAFVLAKRRVSIGSVGVVFAGLAIISAALFVWMAGWTDDPSSAYYATHTRLQALLVGAALAAFMRSGWRPRLAPERIDSLGWFGLTALSAIVILGDEAQVWLYRGGFSLVAVLAAGVIFAAVAGPETGTFRETMSLTPLVMIGRLSYGLYLWHWPIFLFLDEDRVGVDGYTLLAVRIVTSLAVAAASYYVIERPISRAGWSGLRVAIFAVVGVAVLAAAAFTFPSRELVGAGAASASPVGEGDTSFFVVGDSVALELIVGFRPSVAENVAVNGAADLGCGLLQRVRGQKCDNLKSHWLEQVDRFEPEHVLVVASAWDLNDIIETDREIPFGGAAYANYFYEELDRSVGVLGSRGAMVWIVPLPCYDRRADRSTWAGNTEAIDWYNGLLEEYVEGSSREVNLLPYRDLVCPDGVTVQTIDGVEVFAEDGVHLRQQGRLVVWRWLLDQIQPAGAAVDE